MRCVHCGVALTVDIGGGLYSHAHNRQRCQSDAVPYGHMGHPSMPCPPDTINACWGYIESERGEECVHIAPTSPDSGTL
jgi:hypothetical protein